MGKTIVAKGIDVSKHQETIDWEKVKKSGVQFAIIRAGMGKNTIDPFFVSNALKCNEIWLPIGIYWFSYAATESEAKAEAEFCLKTIKNFRVEYPVFFDLEYDTARYLKQKGITLTKAMATAHARAFLSTIEKAGYYAANYANPDYLSHFFDRSLSTYDLWLANYKDNPDLSSPPRDCGIWQYSNHGRVSGVNGKVDLDVCYKDYPSIIKKAELNGLSEKNVEPKWVKNEKGWMICGFKSEWKKIYGFWYYFDSDGIAVTGWQKIKDVWYYFLTAQDAQKTGGKECSCYSLDKS